MLCACVLCMCVCVCVCVCVFVCVVRVLTKRCMCVCVFVCERERESVCAHTHQRHIISLFLNAGPRVPSGGVTLKRRCTYRPSVFYLIVNKLLSLSLSLSSPPTSTFPSTPSLALFEMSRQGADGLEILQHFLRMNGMEDLGAVLGKSSKVTMTLTFCE